MKHLVLIGFLLTNLLASQSVFSSDKVYTWTDAQGVVHYGERPPKDTKATLIRTRTGHSEPTPEASAAPETTAAQQPQVPQQKIGVEKNADQCAAARQNLTTLKGYARVKIADANGETRYLSEAEKQQKMNETQKVIEQVCE